MTKKITTLKEAKKRLSEIEWGVEWLHRCLSVSHVRPPPRQLINGREVEVWSRYITVDGELGKEYGKLWKFVRQYSRNFIRDRDEIMDFTEREKDLPYGGFSFGPTSLGKPPKP